MRFGRERLRRNYKKHNSRTETKKKREMMKEGDDATGDCGIIQRIQVKRFFGEKSPSKAERGWEERGLRYLTTLWGRTWKTECGQKFNIY